MSGKPHQFQYETFIVIDTRRYQNGADSPSKLPIRVSVNIQMTSIPCSTSMSNSMASDFPNAN